MDSRCYLLILFLLISLYLLITFHIPAQTEEQPNDQSPHNTPNPPISNVSKVPIPQVNLLTTQIDTDSESLNSEAIPDVNVSNFLYDCGSVLFTNFSSTFSEFKTCSFKQMGSYRSSIGVFGDSWESGFKKCEALLNPEDLDVRELESVGNSTKWAVLPRCNASSNLLTLGIGASVLAEKQLSLILPSVIFHGADPTINPNLEIFSEIGTFFPFAVGNKTGTDKLRVLTEDDTEEYRDVTVLEFTYLLKEILNFKLVDFLWINTEGSEFQILDYFEKDGEKGLEKNDLTVCQINLEVHPGVVENGIEQLENFLYHVSLDERYVVIKTRTTSFGVYRMFLLNVKDQNCLNKYFL